MSSVTRPSWSADEMISLRTLYPRAPKGDVLAALAGRTWGAIQRKANLEDILRLAHHARIRTVEEIGFIAATLRNRRIARHITQSKLARLVPCHRETLRGWENGSHHPRRHELAAWLKALGAEIRIVDACPDAREPWYGIKGPSRLQLMSRRAA